ncbi:MAG: hypothetical protein KAV83_06520 [Desulfobacterales bacterium]|nr:hypothetical protein [Desulfobacterales bacterium]
MVKFSKVLRMIAVFCLILVIQMMEVASCRADQSGIQTIEKHAAAAYGTLEKMVEAKPGGLRTVVLPFTGYQKPDTEFLTEYKDDSNSDERYFADCLFERLVISKKFKVFTRDKLDKALKELKLQMKDIFDPETAKRVGKFIGADLLFLIEGYIGSGSGGELYYSNGYYGSKYVGAFRVKVLVIDVETAEVKGVWKKFIRY